MAIRTTAAQGYHELDNVTTPGTAARVYQYAYTTIIDWCNSGMIAAMKIDGIWIISKQSLQEHVMSKVTDDRTKVLQVARHILWDSANPEFKPLKEMNTGDVAYLPSAVGNFVSLSKFRVIGNGKTNHIRIEFLSDDGIGNALLAELPADSEIIIAN